MKEGERAARARGTQGIGDDIAAAEPGPGFHETPPEVNRLARRVIEVSPKHSGVAYTEWTNQWQMLEVGLSLRAIGHRAVKVRYVGASPLHLAGHGVEARVQKEMRDKLGVVLDWTGSVG